MTSSVFPDIVLPPTPPNSVETQEINEEVDSGSIDIGSSQYVLKRSNATYDLFQ